MPSVTLRHEIHCDEDTYWSKIFFDDVFNRKLYLEHLQFPGWKPLDQKDDSAKITRRVQVDPPIGNLPGPLKKVLGDRLSYTEEGTFEKASKRYSFKVTPSTLADKTKVSGEMWLEGSGNKKVVRFCRIDVEVKVFMVGGMLEERILSDLRTSYDKGTSFTNDYIAANSL